MTVRITIHGHHLPGRTFCAPDGAPLENVHVAVQVGREPEGLVRGDADAATWTVDVRLIDDGELDFRGKAVQGKRGERFLYLTWGNVEADGTFAMFRRAKLMLNRVDPAIVRAAERVGELRARVHLTDDHGCPRCARVDPPAIEWSVP